MEEMFAGPASVDEIYEALASVERRHVLERLRESDSVDVASLTDGDDDTHVRIQYHHVHLPKLDDHGIVEWDRERNEVSRGPAFDQAERLAESLR